MIEHPLPTPATAKLLYALAIRCAYPNCPEPLYREDELSGRWALNSRICHICARSEGGPRWEPSQSPDDNRADGNLLLMCAGHASMIDDMNTMDTYRADLLREWKVAQVEEHRLRQQGWPLTTAMATDAIHTSFTNVAVAIADSVLHLGGEGGRAPGSGGGGGGAIGPSARAGRGGDGGRITDLDGRPLPPSELMRFMAGVSMGPPPGAGGAGSGALGPNALAGDGGNGGDGFSGALDVEPGDRFEFEVGEGGQPGYLPGQHGSAGGDTVITHRSSDGQIKRVLRARGGAAGASWSMPDDWLPISQSDIDDGCFQISTLFTANSVEMRDGLVFVLGGGWSRFFVPTFPFDTVWPIVCVATWENLSDGHIRGLRLCLSNPDGIETSSQPLDLPAIAVKEKSLTWATGLGVHLDRAGDWRISLRSGDFVLLEMNIAVSIVAAS